MKKDKKFKNTYGWVIKHKKASHMVVKGIYQTKWKAKEDFETMPDYDYDGCGCKSDYEIIKVSIKEVKK